MSYQTTKCELQTHLNNRFGNKQNSVWCQTNRKSAIQVQIQFNFTILGNRLPHVPHVECRIEKQTSEIYYTHKNRFLSLVGSNRKWSQLILLNSTEFCSINNWKNFQNMKQKTYVFLYIRRYVLFDWA